MPLLSPGICAAATPQLVQKLADIEIRTMTDFICANVEELSSKTLIAYKDLLAIRRVILAQFSPLSLNGTDMYIACLDRVAILSTGVDSLNTLLDGGLYTTELTEVAGDISAGKTQLCLNCAASVVMETAQTVCYIDTCCSFSAERIMELIEERLQQPMNDEILDKVHCCQVYDVFGLLAHLDHIYDSIIKQNTSFFSALKLIIIDSLPVVISPILGGKQTDGQSLLMQLGLKLKKLAAEFGLAVLVTNNLVQGEGGQMTAALGKSWQHAPHNRLIFRTDRDEQHHTTSRRATLVKSSRLPTGGSVRFDISSHGLCDPP